MEKRIFLALLVFYTSVTFADITDIKYKTNFGSCPSKSAGSLTISLIKQFEKAHSLKDVKDYILEERLEDKFFLSEYSINYNPVDDSLYLSYDCPRPLMKVQIYRENGREQYTAILAEDGRMLDPTYEVLLRAEKKLEKELPFFALPVNILNSDTHKRIVDILTELDTGFVDYFSEIILSEKSELTIILSVNGHPSSIFLGKGNLEEKVKKMIEIVEYLREKRNVPSIVNLTNAKKVVVKFSESI